MPYGGRGRDWHPKFIEYMNVIVNNENYAGMPCVFRSDGQTYDWTIPSFRAQGSHNWDGNERRRQWWRRKAEELRIEQTGKWISRVAKGIHPGQKPCQVCGREMLVAYAYPQARIIDRINEGLPAQDQLHYHDLLTIWEVIDHVRHALKDDSATVRLLIHAMPKLRELANQDTTIADIRYLVTNNLVPNEYSGFSPGAMANPPDRLDGFHTYNLCCRAKQDAGRSKENLRTYTVERRAFEQWAEGDWGLANRLMSTIGEKIGFCVHRGATCTSQEPTVLTADHIGPISLGFKHAAAFALLCRSCNSAKNNRLSLQDVAWLAQMERDGHWSAASWHARPLWRHLRDEITSNEDALLLSKCLRTNQHLYLTALSTLSDAGAAGALVSLLNLQPAQSRVEVHQSALSQLDGVRVVQLTLNDYAREPRQQSYAESLMGRLIRIAFEALEAYGQKTKRNVRLDEAVAVGRLDLTSELEALTDHATRNLDEDLATFDEDLRIDDADQRESAFRSWVADEQLSRLQRPQILDPLTELQQRVAEAMVLVFKERRSGLLDAE